MSHKQRRIRQQTQLKEEIMTATIDLAHSDGWSAVSIRKIADRIEYSTQKIYELFSGKEDLILELLRRGFDFLAKKMDQAGKESEDPTTNLFSISDAYCNFAWENPALYRIMYGLDGVPFGVNDTWEEGMKIGSIAAEVLQKRYPHLSEGDLLNHVETIWSLMHGVIALTMAGRILGGYEKSKIHIHQALSTYLEKL